MSFIPHPIHLKPPVKNMDWTNQNLWQIVTETRTGQTTFLSSGMLLLGLVIGSVFKAHAMHKEIINCCSLMLTNLPVLGRALHVSDVWTKGKICLPSSLFLTVIGLIWTAPASYTVSYQTGPNVNLLFPRNLSKSQPLTAVKCCTEEQKGKVKKCIVLSMKGTFTCAFMTPSWCTSLMRCVKTRQVCYKINIICLYTVLCPSWFHTYRRVTAVSVKHPWWCQR